MISLHLCVSTSRNVHHVPALLAVNFKELIYMHYMTRSYQWNAREIMIFSDYGEKIYHCLHEYFQSEFNDQYLSVHSL